MEITYIIESEYYDGEKYADKCYGIEDLLTELADIAHDEQNINARIRLDKIKITVEGE